jgi:chitin disaccharide deacetylase
MLLVNADDLGWTREITDRILTCYHQQRIQAASIMTFMKDSERAASLAKESGLPIGLHLNLMQDFTGNTISSTLQNQLVRVAAYLKARKFNQIFYNPMLNKAFDYVFQAQWDEFIRLYGEEPKRLDGHHHMHLCMNMIASGRYPNGLRIRRNFTFNAGEKDPFNRLYRYLVDRWLKARFLCTDFFFSMAPIDKGKLQRWVLLSKSSEVEIMVHPGVEKEYSFLLSLEWADLISGNSVVQRSRYENI